MRLGNESSEAQVRALPSDDYLMINIGMDSYQDTLMWTKRTLMSLECEDISMVPLLLELE